MGIKLLVWRVIDPRWAAVQAQAAAREAAEIAGREALKRSNAIAPKRSGALIASSGYTVDGARATVRYTAPYARIQHDGRFRHPSGGQARYLTSVTESAGLQGLADGAFAKALVKRIRG